MSKLRISRISRHVGTLYIPCVITLAVVFSLITFLKYRDAGDGSFAGGFQASGNIGP